jgi:hypothetical protein
MNALPESACFRRAGVLYRLGALEDDAEMRALLREASMESEITASLEREPSCFERSETPGRVIPIVARSETPPHDLIAMCTCHFMPVFSEGKTVDACYLGGLRLNGKYRGRAGVLKGGFDAIPILLPEARRSPLIFTSVARDNLRARRILEAGLNGMPEYRLLGDMETFAVSVRRGKKYGLLERARPSDVGEIVAFHNGIAAGGALSPVLEEEWLNRTGIDGEALFSRFLVYRENRRIAACLAVWDQRRYKQIVIKKYGQPLASLRPFWNIWARCARRQLLPSAGRRLEQVFLAFLAFAPSVAGREVFFIREALLTAEAMNADSALFGVSASSPSRENLKRALKPYIYVTRIESVELRGGVPPLPVPGVVHPEVALL